eukprot:bmy_11580T0
MSPLAVLQVAARTGETGVRRRTQAMSRSASKRRSRFSSLWGLDTTSKKKQGRPSINQVFGEGTEAVKKSLEGIFDDTVPDGKREKEMVLPSVHQHSPDCDIWVHEYFTPSWFCLPNNKPVLTVVRPGDTARDALELICKRQMIELTSSVFTLRCRNFLIFFKDSWMNWIALTILFPILSDPHHFTSVCHLPSEHQSSSGIAHRLDHSAHYLRLKFLIENKMQHYVPKPEEDIYELLYKEIEICPKVTQNIQIAKSDTAGDNYGFSLSSVEEDGVRRLYVNSVKETGLASKKGTLVLDKNKRSSAATPLPHIALFSADARVMPTCPPGWQTIPSIRPAEGCVGRGLKAGDEILEINNRAAGTLNASVLKDFLAQLSLGLLVRTYPELEGGAELLGSPPLRLDGPADLSENPLAFLTSNTGMAVHRAAPWRLPMRLAYSEYSCFSKSLLKLGLGSKILQNQVCLVKLGNQLGSRIQHESKVTVYRLSLMGLNGALVNASHPSKSKINQNVSFHSCVCTASNLIVVYPANGYLAHGHSLCSQQGSSAETAPEETEGPDLESSDETDHSSKSTEQVAAFCRSLHEMNPSDPSPSPQDSAGPQLATMRQLTDADKLRKVICELLETERTYVKDLNCLMERYLKPLQKETFLTQDELDVLFGNLTEMVEFQVEFLKTLEDGVRLVPDLEKLEKVDQFKKVLFSLGGSFLYYADRFKLYSAFCASHTKVPKVLVKAKMDVAFKAFLDAQNPKQQHSSTLESYLIKPIQRILKYPLLLKELFALTDAESEEHYHLDLAIKTMNKVASHINEMQKIHEEFGAVFDQLIAEQTGEKKEVADLSMGDLLLHTTVIWPNPPASLGKWKKEPELAAFVFKTAVVLVYKDGSKQKRKLVGSHRLSIYEDWDPFRFRHMIPTEALQVRALASADAEANAVCEIVHVKSESEGRPERVFHLCCSSPESRKDFLKAVHSILRDKHRRQLLKTESLPSSQQYVPFGGKRLCALKGARPAMSRAASVFIWGSLELLLEKRNLEFKWSQERLLISVLKNFPPVLNCVEEAGKSFITLLLKRLTIVRIFKLDDLKMVLEWMIEHSGMMMEAQGSETEGGQSGSQFRPLSSSLTLYLLYLKPRLHLAVIMNSHLTSSSTEAV